MKKSTWDEIFRFLFKQFLIGFKKKKKTRDWKNAVI